MRNSTNCWCCFETATNKADACVSLISLISAFILMRNLSASICSCVTQVIGKVFIEAPVETNNFIDSTSPCSKHILANVLLEKNKEFKEKKEKENFFLFDFQKNELN